MFGRDDGQWWGQVRDEHSLYRWHRTANLQPDVAAERLNQLVEDDHSGEPLVFYTFADVDLEMRPGRPSAGPDRDFASKRGRSVSR